MSATTPPHREWEQLVVDHVLGRLTPADDVRARDHLRDCATCPTLARETAATAAALRRIAPDPSTVGEEADAVAPRELDERMAELFATGIGGPAPAARASSGELPTPQAHGTAGVVHLRDRRRPLLLVAAAAAVAGLLTGSATTALVVRDDAPVAAPAPAPTPQVLPVRALDIESGVSATAGVVDHTWGVEIRLTTEGLPAGRTYRVVITDDDGRRYDAGAFVGVTGRPVVCSMNGAVLLARAARFVVLDDGRAVISGDLPAPRT